MAAGWPNGQFTCHFNLFFNKELTSPCREKDLTVFVDNLVANGFTLMLDDGAMARGQGSANANQGKKEVGKLIHHEVLHGIVKLQMVGAMGRR